MRLSVMVSAGEVLWWGAGLVCAAVMVAVTMLVARALWSSDDRPFPAHRIALGPDDLREPEPEESGKGGRP